ncbi:hypothetical protein DFH28DRAFT_1080794 [Melampsora americana]|nr:hypothetical protein DFH28DRAFT_1080794 [Melampsora americana]
MSLGGSGPENYGPHGNGPLPARGPLNPNDPSLKQYNLHSFLPSTQEVIETQLLYHHNIPTPIIPPIHSATATQSTILPVFDALATQANLNAENQERACICSNPIENDPRLIGLVVYTAHCHQDLIQRLTQPSATQPCPTSLSTITPTDSTPEWVPKEALKKFCVDVLLESISDPNLQVYTLTKGVISAAGQKKTLIHLLEMIVQMILGSLETFYQDIPIDFPARSSKKSRKKSRLFERIYIAFSVTMLAPITAM